METEVCSNCLHSTILSEYRAEFKRLEILIKAIARNYKLNLHFNTDERGLLVRNCASILDQSKHAAEAFNIEKELTCNLMTEILSYQLDLKSLQDLADHNQQVITKISNENEAFKQKLKKLDNDNNSQEHHLRELSLNVKELKEEKSKLRKQNEGYQLKLSRKMKEVDFYREQNQDCKDEIESYQNEVKAQAIVLKNNQEEIDYFLSDTYQMEIALPYTEEVERKQQRINELEVLNGLEVSSPVPNKRLLVRTKSNTSQKSNASILEDVDELTEASYKRDMMRPNSLMFVPEDIILSKEQNHLDTHSEPSTPYEHIEDEFDEWPFSFNTGRKSTKF